ncbi:MAG: hypothetical protein AB7V45_14105 [Candidatus Krumholzibacteriia bacterium]
MKVVVTGLILLLLTAAWSPAAPPAAPTPGTALRFVSEIIRISIEPDSLHIEGRYFLLGTGEREQIVPLFYPYPEDERLGTARTLLLEARTDGDWTPLSFADRADGKGVLWWIPVSPGHRLEVRTEYRQQRLDDYGRYIVTSTRAWGRPLDHARFEIYLPEGAVRPEFSHPFVKGTDSCGECWIFEMDNFWPDRDIIVQWE